MPKVGLRGFAKAKTQADFYCLCFCWFGFWIVVKLINNGNF